MPSRRIRAMSLPLKPLPMVERWDCHQCGVCCRGSIVPLSAEDLARLEAQHWDQHPDYEHTPVVVRESWLGHAWRLAQRADGSCVFLMPDGLCRIHKEHGFDAKPLVCRMFPLQVVPREQAAYLTIRRACPSAAADRGRPVAEHLPFAKQLARERGLAEAAPHPPPLKAGEHRGWPAARRLLESLERLLTDQRYPLVRRLVHVAILCRLLEQAKTRTLADDRLFALLNLLETNIADEVGDLFTARQPPAAAAAVLFRQTGAEIARLHPRYVARPGWGERLRLVRAAWTIVRGAGPLPDLPPAFPAATFKQLEGPLGVLEPAIYQPLTRFVEATAVSWSYALANRQGWSIIDSARMLVLLYPVGLWLLRWQAAGRAPQPSDLPELITALDRSQGYPPLAGGKQRRRVNVLARMEQLERLVVWYAR